MTDNDSVRVGRGFQGRKATCNDESASQKSTESSLLILGGREVSDWPEENGSERVKSKPHEDCNFVAFAFEDLGGDWRETKIATTEVHNLETGRFETRYTEDGLEMLVEDIEEAVRETPEEEEGDDQTQRIDEFLAAEISTGDARDIRGNATTSHCSASESETVED